MPEPVPYTLAVMAQGAAGELWQREFADVLRNIADINTDHKTKRTITLRVTIVPNEDRDIGHAVVDVQSRLAPVKRLATTLYVGRHQGRLVAVENNPKQADLFDKGAPKPVAVTGGKD